MSYGDDNDAEGNAFADVFKVDDGVVDIVVMLKGVIVSAMSLIGDEEDEEDDVDDVNADDADDEDDDGIDTDNESMHLLYHSAVASVGNARVASPNRDKNK